VLADFGLGQLPVVEGAAVRVGVAVYAAEVPATATVKTCYTASHSCHTIEISLTDYESFVE